MRILKSNGVLEEIFRQYPNIDISEFLQERLQIPDFKAEELAARIEKEYSEDLRKAEQNYVTTLFEKDDGSDFSVKPNFYSVGSLSAKEFENFTRWLIIELGYEIQPQSFVTDVGIDLVATRDGEKIAFIARKCPLTYRVSNSIILIAQQFKQAFECARSIVLVATHFTQQAIIDAQKANVELWDIDTFATKIAEVRKKADIDMQSLFPKFQGSLLQSLKELDKTKVFVIEVRAGDKFDLNLPGVKFPLLTFQVRDNEVSRCVLRIKYNEPVGEAEGEVLIKTDRNCRTGPEEETAYDLILRYLEQFLE